MFCSNRVVRIRFQKYLSRPDRLRTAPLNRLRAMSDGLLSLGSVKHEMQLATVYQNQVCTKGKYSKVKVEAYTEGRGHRRQEPRASGAPLADWV